MKVVRKKHITIVITAIIFTIPQLCFAHRGIGSGNHKKHSRDGFYTQEQCNMMPEIGMAVPPDCEQYRSKNTKSNVIKKEDKLYTASKENEDISEHSCVNSENIESIKLMTMSMDIPSDDRTALYPMVFSVYGNVANEIICTQIKYSGSCKRYCVDAEMIKNRKQNTSSK